MRAHVYDRTAHVRVDSMRARHAEGPSRGAPALDAALCPLQQESDTVRLVGGDARLHRHHQSDGRVRRVHDGPCAHPGNGMEIARVYADAGCIDEE